MSSSSGWRSTAPHAFAYLQSTVTISSCVQAITEVVYISYTQSKNIAYETLVCSIFQNSL